MHQDWHGEMEWNGWIMKGKKPLQLHAGVIYSPSFGKVSPVGHNHSTQHYVVLREVAAEEISWADHWDAKNIWKLIPVRGIGPGRLHFTLAVVVEGVEIRR